MKFKFDNMYGCRHLLNDDIMGVTDVMSGRIRALVCGYGDDTAMWAKVAFSLSVILVLVCSSLTVTLRWMW